MAIAIVNKSTGTADGSATSLAAAAANHTGGNLIVVGVVWSNNTTVSSITDTAGNTYVSTGQKASNGTSDHTEVFYAKNIAGNASNVVTANFSAGSTFRRIMVYQVSGCDTTAPFATGEGGTAVATGTSITSSSWTTATADEIILAFMGSTGGGSGITAGSGYTLETSNLGTDSDGESKIVAATGSQAPNFTWTGSQTAWLAAASFKAASAGGTTVVQPSPGVLALGAGTHAPAEQLAAPAGVLNLRGDVHQFTEQLAPPAGILVLGAGTHTVQTGADVLAPAGVLALRGDVHVLDEAIPQPSAGVLNLTAGQASIPGGSGGTGSHTHSIHPHQHRDGDE